MNGPVDEYSLTTDQGEKLEVQAAKVFQPRAPISAREFFAGRWTQITTLADAVGQTGLHVVIYGERGVGKTSLANVVRPIVEVFDSTAQEPNEESGDENPKDQARARIVIKANANADDTFSSIWEKLFEDLTWVDDTRGIGYRTKIKGRVPLREAFDLPDELGVDDVRRVISRVQGGPVFIVDEFDRAAAQSSREFTDLIKALSDYAVDCTVILVGVSDTVDDLVVDHASINRTLVQILLPRMEAQELHQILENAEKALSVKFSQEAASLIVTVSQGLPHYTHLVGLHAVRISARSRSAYVEKSAVFEALKEAVKQAQQTVTEKHLKATHSAHKDALYRQVLLACALAAAKSHDALGYFNPSAVVDPLEEILDRKVQIASFNGHLSQFCEAKRGSVLERTGHERSFRFRFRDPLLVPFVFMDAIAIGLLSSQKLSMLLGARF